MSLSSHQSSHMKSDEWLTPPDILRKLGIFDLDPCASIKRPWPTAIHHYTIQDDGLLKPWFGRIWLNPPFGNRSKLWIEKLCFHGDGIAMLPARTETRLFFEYVWNKAHAICFLMGRPHFYYIDGTRAKFNSGAPICLIAYGESNIHYLKRCNGKTLCLRNGGGI